MEMLSGGFYKATIHRVVQPPADQRGFARLGTYYFAMADDDVKLSPVQSPVLERVGTISRFEDAPTMAEWRKMRYRTFGLKKAVSTEDGREDQLFDEKGVLVMKYYN